MGRYDFRPQRVLAQANLLLETGRIPTPPPWYNIIQDVPPSAALTRPILRDARTILDEQAARALPRHGTALPKEDPEDGPNRKKASHKFPRLGRHLRDQKMRKIFQPRQMGYSEDRLRGEFFNDHPWELARPKVVLEDSGNDAKGWDWSHIKQPGKRLDGDSVVYRQLWLMEHKGQSKAHAYDTARKEFYFHRHLEDVERRVAKEEAMAVGAWFGPGPLEVGMQLENKTFNNWKRWALEQVELENQKGAAQYTGQDPDEDIAVGSAEEVELDQSLLEKEVLKEDD